MAYYPPYHSKYNPTERCWGVHPIVQRVTTIYEASVKLTQYAMRVVETKLQRLPDSGKWFVDVLPVSARPSTG